MTGPEPQSPSPHRQLNRAWLLLGVAVLLVVFVRARLLSMPLERDEGEYAYAGQLMLQHIPPYLLAYNMKLPGTYAAYGAIMAVFGQSAEGIHLGLLVVNVACMLLVFLLGRRLFDATAGAVAAACYGVVSLSPAVLGLAAHATHFVTLAMLGGTLCLLRATARPRRAGLFASGLLFGLALVMKQQGVFFGIFGGVWLLWNGGKTRPVAWRRLGEETGCYGLGFALPYAMVCLALWQAGVFGNYWFWTFTYARQYASQVSWGDGAGFLGSELWRLAVPHWPLVLLALAGVFLLWRRRRARGQDWFLTLFLGFSALAVTPGHFFREHYFVLLLPAVSLLVGITISFLGQSCDPMVRRLPRWLPGLVAVAALVYPVCQQGRLFFVLSPETAIRTIYGDNPFLESVDVADYIREHSAGDARVFVFGSEPEIYFYARRHSASGYIYMYDLVEDQPYAREMQERMEHEIETVKPEYLVLVRSYPSWIINTRASLSVLDWGAQYCRANYDVVGAVDIISQQETHYTWGEAARSYVFRSPTWIYVFQRKPAG